jgi:hypothetical protein
MGIIMGYRKLASILVFLSIWVCVIPAGASLSNVYIAQTAKGASTGVDCANAYAGTFFNTAGNWGSGASQIGPVTVVHLCGTWTGGGASTLLTFQGSGASGHPITLLFEPGAVMQPNYCSSNGCINLNAQSYLVIDGGQTCGETGKWIVTPCNGQIQNYAVGSPGKICPNGSACVPISGSVQSVAIGSSINSSTNIEVRNLKIGPLFIRDAGDTSDNGMQTYGLGLFSGNLSQQITMHHMVFTSMAKGYLVSLGSSSGTLSGYHVYNSNFTDQCWAMGVGANAPNMNITALTFHDNEVSNWNNWAPGNTTGNVCHTNGTMWFNGDGSTVHVGTGFIGDSASGMWNNYLHGDLAGNVSFSSPSGILSCQDNCVNILVYNNVLVSSCTGLVGSCGGIIYFNGAGGGGQQVYNNTLVAQAGSCVVVTGQIASAIIKNNIYKGCGTTLEIRPNTLGAARANRNNGYSIGSSSWMGYNSASSGIFQSLTQYQINAGQDINSTIGNPILDGSYGLQVGSSAIGLGENLTGLGIMSLNADAAGQRRPAVGAWDAGAFMFGSVTDFIPPIAPLNLTIH